MASKRKRGRNGRAILHAKRVRGDDGASRDARRAARARRARWRKAFEAAQIDWEKGASAYIAGWFAREARFAETEAGDQGLDGLHSDEAAEVK